MSEPAPTNDVAALVARLHRESGMWASAAPETGMRLLLTDAADALERQAADRERLALVRRALLADGYFTEAEVGPDLAPRVTERFSAYAADLAAARAEAERLTRLLHEHAESIIDQQARAYRAERQVAAVRALCDTWEHLHVSIDADCELRDIAAPRLRAALDTAET